LDAVVNDVVMRHTAAPPQSGSYPEYRPTP
jgi:hypothetical protein